MVHLFSLQEARAWLSGYRSCEIERINTPTTSCITQGTYNGSDFPVGEEFNERLPRVFTAGCVPARVATDDGWTRAPHTRPVITGSTADLTWTRTNNVTAIDLLQSDWGHPTLRHTQLQVRHQHSGVVASAGTGKRETGLC